MNVIGGCFEFKKNKRSKTPCIDGNTILDKKFYMNSFVFRPNLSVENVIVLKNNLYFAVVKVSLII